MCVGYEYMIVALQMNLLKLRLSAVLKYFATKGSLETKKDSSHIDSI